MKRILASLITIGALTSISVLHYELRLNIVPRYENGTIQADVERVQRPYSSVAGVDVSLLESFKRRVQANMIAIKAHVGEVKCANGQEDYCPQRADWSL